MFECLCLWLASSIVFFFALGTATWFKFVNCHVLVCSPRGQLHAWDEVYWCLVTHLHYVDARLKNSSVLMSYHMDTWSQPIMNRSLVACVIGCYRIGPLLWRSGFNFPYVNAWPPTGARAIGLAISPSSWIFLQSAMHSCLNTHGMGVFYDRLVVIYHAMTHYYVQG